MNSHRGGKRLLENGVTYSRTLTEKVTAAEQIVLKRYHCTEMNEELKA